MASPARTLQFTNSALRISETTNHCVRRYEGDPHELIDRMVAERRTGVTMIFHNAGFVYMMKFDSRVKEPLTENS